MNNSTCATPHCGLRKNNFVVDPGLCAICSQTNRQGIKSTDKEKARDIFLSMLSHELRSPLTSILTWAQLLKTTKASAKMRIGLDCIEESAITQNKIINELLEISAIIFDKASFQLSEHPLDEILQTVINVSQPQINAKNLRLQARFEKNLKITGDYSRLQQALLTLLKHTIHLLDKNESISLCIQRNPKNGQEGLLFITNNSFRLINDFCNDPKLHRFSVRSEGHLGLGLALTTCILKLHGGDLQSFHHPKNAKIKFIVISLPLI